MAKFKMVAVRSSGKGYSIVGIDKSFSSYNEVRKYCHTNKLTIAKRTITLKNGKREEVPAKYVKGAV